MELQWNSLEGSSLPLRVELSWNLKAAGSAWETASQLVGGCRVRKKNLAPGSACRFRLRYGIVDTPSSAKGRLLYLYVSLGMSVVVLITGISIFATQMLAARGASQ